MSPTSFFLRESFRVVCEGRLYGFQLRIALHGVKNAVDCVVQAGNDDSCRTRSKQLTVATTKMCLCAQRGMFLHSFTGEDRFLSESLWRTALRGVVTHCGGSEGASCDPNWPSSSHCASLAAARLPCTLSVGPPSGVCFVQTIIDTMPSPGCFRERAFS